MPAFASLTRRSFLRYAALSAGFLTLSRVRVAPALATAGATAPGLQVLTPNQAEIFTAIAERMVDSGDPTMPAVRDTRAIVSIDQALVQVDPAVQSQLGWLLIGFQWGPPLLQFKFKTFTGMTAPERDRYLQDWADSRLLVRRLAFRALKNLSMLGYYAQDATWKGIHYDGPWAPRPRRVVSAEC